MKTCFKCGHTKPVELFYAHPQMGDGYLGKCKECTKADVAARTEVKKLNPEWVASERERCRIKSARARSQGTHHTSQEAKKAWERRNKHKRKAQGIAARAQRVGFLIAPPCCQGCGQIAPLQKHHPDYSQPVLVWWLCTACHGKAHRKDNPLIISI